MKIWILTLLFAAGASAQTAHRTAAKKQPAAQASTGPVAIPKDAVRTDDGYRWVDKKGKVWIFRQTPFGVTKAAYKAPEPVQPATATSSRTAAAEQGDSIRFTADTPFGPSTWTRKKTELTPGEQAIWDRQRQQANR